MWLVQALPELLVQLDRLDPRVLKARPEPTEPPVRKVPRVLLVLLAQTVLKALQVLKVSPAQLVSRVLKASKGLLVRRVQPVPRELTVQPDPKEFKDLREPQAQQVLPGLMVRQVPKDPKAWLGRRGSKARLGQPVFKAFKEMLGRKVLLVPKVRKEFKAPLDQTEPKASKGRQELMERPVLVRSVR